MSRLKINHDILCIDNDNEEWVISSDNSGAIGEKKYDEVRVPYEVVSYFNFRVCYMECVAAGAEPVSLIVSNFNGDGEWEKLRLGIAKGCSELDKPLLPITGSSESNFALLQSATALSMIGKRKKSLKHVWDDKMKDHLQFAVVGKPLVGPEVVAYGDEVASLQNFNWLSQQKEVIGLIPVGSKGIAKEIKKVAKDLKIDFTESLDIHKSAGPATCYLVIYENKFENKLMTRLNEVIYKGVYQ